MNAPKTSVPFVDLSLQHQPLNAEIERALQRVVTRGDFILGQAVREFEQEFAAFCGVSYGVGVASGTDAIALGLQACGIGVGDEVLVPANTFIATLLGVHKAGANPVLVDCDAQTALIDLAAAEQAMTPKTRVIMPVHLYGQMVSPKQVLDFAKKHQLLIFEDAAQAHGATREGYRGGSIGIAAAFSFYPSKNLGSMGNGGMVVTPDETIAQRVRTLRNYGAPQKYFHTDLGINSRLDTLQASVLQVKLPYLKQWNQQRYQAAQTYDRLLADLGDRGIRPMENHSDDGHIYHLYVIHLGKSGGDRDHLQKILAEDGIQTGIHYPLACHLQPAFAYLGYQKGDFPNTENLCQNILSLPMYPGLKNSQIEYVIAQFKTYLST